jgi:hypothetical protein
LPPDRDIRLKRFDHKFTVDDLSDEEPSAISSHAGRCRVTAALFTMPVSKGFHT